jgi:hypothetical protein
VEEPQRQETVAVGDGDGIAATAAEVGLYFHHLALDQAFRQGLQAVERHDPAAVLVTQRQVEDEVAEVEDAQSFELFRHSGPDTREIGDAAIAQRGRTRRGAQSSPAAIKAAA